MAEKEGRGAAVRAAALSSRGQAQVAMTYALPKLSPGSLPKTRLNSVPKVRHSALRACAVAPRRCQMAGEECPMRAVQQRY